MANKNFIVQNGLTVGGVSIDATSGNITTTGVLTSTNSEHPAEFQGNLTVGGALTLNGLLLDGTGGTTLTVDGALTATDGTFTTLTADSLDVAGGGLNGVAIGATTPSTGAFTTLTASGVTTVTDTTETTSTSTGALKVSGGASIAKNGYIGNNLYIGSGSFDKSLTSPTIIATDNGSNYAQIAMINSNGNGSADFAAYADNGTDSAGWMDMGIAGSTFNDGNYTITKAHDGYIFSKPLDNSYGGNLVIATSELGSHKDIVIGVGGFSSSSEVARFHGNVSTNGSFKINYTTQSTNSTTGALVVAGGAAVGGDLTVQGNINASYLNTINSSQLEVTSPLVYLTGDAYPYDFDIGLYSHFVGGPANVYSHTGAVRSYQNGYWGFFSNVQQEPTGTVNWTDAGLIWDTIKVGAATIANTTAATSTTSGALTVAGGVGVSGAVYIGGNGTNSIVHTGHIMPSANLTYNLGSSSAWYGTFYGVSTQAKYADLAENYQADQKYAPGTVLMFGGSEEVTIATADTTAVAGVVSTNPAHLMNGQLSGMNVVALALTGRVPCNVVGPVKKGDIMVSAGFGFAKVNNKPEPGTIIGKALNDFNGAKGQIEVVVGRF